MSLVFPSFGKLNWILRIVGRREDGYHQIQTLFQTIDLCDEIEVQHLSHPGIELKVEGRPVVPGSENLLYRAAEAFLGETSAGTGVRIRLTKRIPVGAGLGGGSGNAASLLLALRTLWPEALSNQQLVDLAARLGSDIPFFLWGGTAWGEGRGEQISVLEDLPEIPLLLYYPAREISAREAYSLGKWGPPDRGRELTSREVGNKILRFREAARSGSWRELPIENDFDEPLFRHFPYLEEARRILGEAGCQRVMICGSGSTLLGLAPVEELGQVAAEAQRQLSGDVFLSRTLSRTDYRELLERSGLKGLDSDEDPDLCRR